MIDREVACPGKHPRRLRSASTWTNGWLGPEVTALLGSLAPGPERVSPGEVGLPEELALGVLSPYLGGWYFGGLITGISHRAAVLGASVVAIQTLDAGTGQLEVDDPADLDSPIAWGQVSGFVVIINATSSRSLAAIRAAGLPVVAISHEFSGLDVPVVLPDNRTGIREAVTHLIEHGHRKIAFTGYVFADDIQARYQAYCETLREHGLAADPHLLFRAADNQAAGGVGAARDMIAAGMPATAVIAGTDANAIGLMRTLQAAGCRVPEDQAIIGFDDTEAAAYVTPRLTSVRQPINTIGQRATQLLVDLVRGENVADERHYVPTSLVVRESCGCSAGPAGPARAALDGAADLMGEGARTAVHSSAPPVLAEISGAVAQVFAAVTGSADSGETAEVRQRCESMLLGLVRAQGRAHFADSAFLQATVSAQYEVSMHLLRSHEDDPRRLQWLRATSTAAGCLGLWTGAPTDVHTTLRIAGTFVRDETTRPLPLVHTEVSPADFPPTEVLAASKRPGMAVFVVPVRVSTSDWGLLATVDAVETRVATGREPVSNWAALLAVALDHQDLLRTLREQEDRLRMAALYDELTGLPNRVLFLDRLRQAIGRAGRQPEHQIGVLFLDLDGFKVVNDSLGHSAGDVLLVQVAERLRSVLRDLDTVARFGGDEFLILVDGAADPYTPSHVARRIREALARPFLIHGQEVVVSASIGIAIGRGRDEPAEDLVRDADLAMYAAKSHEKGSHEVFDTAMHTRAVSRLRVETDLRQALERDEFEVHYQPIVHMPTGQVHAFEALIRWRRPGQGLLAPADFLGVAEETGLILPIGRWILEESCRRLAEWRLNAACPDLCVSVNVSNRQFWSGTLVDDLEECLRRTRLAPAGLALEITEGVIMRNVDRARKTLDELHDLGCRLSIDDFGTGYSSLEILHQLPIDTLKIDQSFVARLDTQPRSVELVRTIVQMAGNLGLDLIAEGIETGAQRERLEQLGCSHGQGFLYSPAVPATTAEALLTTRFSAGVPLSQRP